MNIWSDFIRRTDFTNPLVSHLLVYLMLTGNHTTSLRKLSVNTGISLQSTRTALRQLEVQGDITTTKTGAGTVISLGEYTDPTPSPVTQQLSRDDYFLKARNITRLNREEILDAFRAGVNINDLIKNA